MTIEYMDYIEEDTVATLYRQTGSGTSLIIRPMLFAYDSMPAGCERILPLYTSSVCGRACILHRSNFWQAGNPIMPDHTRMFERVRQVALGKTRRRPWQTCIDMVNHQLFHNIFRVVSFWFNLLTISIIFSL